MENHDDYGIVVERFVVIVAESVIVILQQRLTELLLGRMNREAGSRGGCDVADDYRFGHCDGSYLRMRKAEFCRSEEHTSELQSLMRNSYAVFCLKKKNNTVNQKKPEYI